ncbi:MAG: VPLPA-CTERM-specific exosortase XrtD [Pseudomonadota bacterium]
MPASLSNRLAAEPRIRSRDAGLLWLGMAVVGAFAFFWEGILTLIDAWQAPEYSHGWLIPILSGVILLRHLKSVPVNTGPVPDRWPGVALIVIALLVGLAGNLARIGDIVAYALILWTGGILLVSFGWRTGRQFWASVLHLVFMLPLPGLLYFKLSTTLQFISSELGVWLLQLTNVVVYLEGNIIDFGVFKLHVAEACSGLRYLFPILSFSYIFAVLYRGPAWHKAVLLLSAAPITIAMNSVRIAIVGLVVNAYGIEHAEGFSHFLEGWVIFVTCVLILFALAWILMRLDGRHRRLVDALDLDTEGLWNEARRIALVRPSSAMIVAALLGAAAALTWHVTPRAPAPIIDREPLGLFPSEIGGWTAGDQVELEPAILRTLGADDYLSVAFTSASQADGVALFIAWYDDQTKGGIHSPEVCLPGAGWEMAEIERVDLSHIAGTVSPFQVNRAVIQKGVDRLLVYYWFEQHGRRIAWDFAAKFNLIWDGLLYNRTDGALVRLITPIGEGETPATAELRLNDMLANMIDPLERFVPVDPRVVAASVDGR